LREIIYTTGDAQGVEGCHAAAGLQDVVVAWDAVVAGTAVVAASDGVAVVQGAAGMAGTAWDVVAAA
jgi:hypothetical protein